MKTIFSNCEAQNLDVLKSAITCNEIINLYRDLLDSYVSDFYLEKHWTSRLPKSWKEFLENISIAELADLLSHNPLSSKLVPPLSLLSLQTLHNSFAIQRTCINNDCLKEEQEDFMKYLCKNVKLKKRHEINIMSDICYKIGVKTSCFNVVDIGSGLGHLSRLLAYRHGFNVRTFEANPALTTLAAQHDSNFERILKAKKISSKNEFKPIHINRIIDSTLSTEGFESLIRKAFDNYSDNFSYGIIGLHPCGDLGSTLLKFYNNSSAKFIVVVSCCYMKISLDPSPNPGYPLSAFYKSQNYKLNYLSCEAACHSIENFIVKLKNKDYLHLKVHSYRAALECILAKSNYNMRHSAISNVKYTEGLSFEEYCLKATRKYNLQFNNRDLKYYESLIEDSWTSVVKFYCVRLFLAPLVESIILYDRLLYLEEQKSECIILPAFDCKISPRNHVLIARKIV
ncbi:hypothetical protein ABEB36_004365 [Hypothenemus hampei]|uniref:Methyltransferase domain-containing protein n=1 Tax=Hypothenemus hampei TaxID=57062 RepID=A0ABD1F3F8_HYPHA